MRAISWICALFVSGAAAAWGQGLTINNASFETDAVAAFPTYRTSITGWTMSDGTGYGVNTTAGPFMDNGSVPDGSKVLFLQNRVAASQQIAGFVAGRNYTLRLHANSRASTTAGTLKVSVGGQTVFGPTPIASVGGTSPFRLVEERFFSSTSGTQTLRIESTTNAVDNTLLIDNVQLFETPASATSWDLFQ